MSQSWAACQATIDAIVDVGFLPNGDLVTAGETLSRWSPPYSKAVDLSADGPVHAVEIAPGESPRIFAVTRMAGSWHLLERSPGGDALQVPLPVEADRPARLHLSPGRDRLLLRADVSRVWLLELKKERRWIQLDTKHVNDVAFSPSAPHLVLLLVGTSSLSFRSGGTVKPAGELWDLSQDPVRCVQRLRLPGRPNVAEPLENGGWLIGLRTGEVLQVDQQLNRVEDVWRPLELELTRADLGLMKGIPVFGLATPGRDRLIVVSSHDDRAQAWLSLHARLTTGSWAWRERLELPGRTLSVPRSLLSPDGSTLALVLRDGPRSRCEVYRLR